MIKMLYEVKTQIIAILGVLFCTGAGRTLMGAACWSHDQLCRTIELILIDR